MTTKAPVPCADLVFPNLPFEVQIHAVSYLRAYDLGALSQTCHHFQSKEHVQAVIQHVATVVYPKELTEGYATAPPLFGGASPVKKQKATGKAKTGRKLCKVDSSSVDSSGSTKCTYEALRDLEMLVLVRVLNRPEPPVRLYQDDSTMHDSMNDSSSSHFYVSKSWCKAALKWLEAQDELRREAHSRSASPAAQHGKKKKKLSKKQERLLSRRLSDACSPPWPNVNDDLLCPHANLRRCNSKSARAKRRIVDKQAWKVLRKLYPESVQLHLQDDCPQCFMELEAHKFQLRRDKERDTEERKKPLANPLIRAFYARPSRGVPHSSLANHNPPHLHHHKHKHKPSCPLLPGVYHAVPRSWCHLWRKYIKTGCTDAFKRGACMPPDSSVLLCDAHKLPLIPPHLDHYLSGFTEGLLAVPPAPPPSHNEAVTSSPFAFPSSSTDMATICVEDANMNGQSQDTAVAAAVAFGRTVNIDVAVESQCAALLSLGISPHQQQQPHHGGENEATVEDDGFSGTGHAASSIIPAASSSSATTTPMLVPPASPLGATNTPPAFSSPPAATTPPPHSHLDHHPPSSTTTTTSSCTRNEMLDQENKVVIELLTDEEFHALEEAFWPELQGGSFTLKFAVTESSKNSCRDDDDNHHVAAWDGIQWCTMPCRECDAGHASANVVVRNRSRGWLKKTPR